MGNAFPWGSGTGITNFPKQDRLKNVIVIHSYGSLILATLFVV